LRHRQRTGGDRTNRQRALREQEGGFRTRLVRYQIILPRTNKAIAMQNGCQFRGHLKF
jgi:hypothetical protein